MNEELMREKNEIHKLIKFFQFFSLFAKKEETTKEI